MLTLLAKNISQGDRDAESKLVDHFSSYVTRLLHRVFHDHQLCLDLYQETFAHVIVKLRLGQVNNPEALKSYISSTALYLGFSLKRQKKFELGDDKTIEKITAGDPTPYKHAENIELSEFVSRSIALMTIERDRQLLIELYLDQMSKLAICNQYNLSPLQFDRLHYRAKSRLKRIMLKTNVDFISAALLGGVATS